MSRPMMVGRRADGRTCHASVDSNLYRTTLWSTLLPAGRVWFSMAWAYLPPPPEAELFKGGAGSGGGGRHRGGLRGLLPGRDSAAFGGADHRRRHRWVLFNSAS